MVARAQAADSDICVLVDASIVLLPEIVTLLTNLSKIGRDWFLVSTSRNISDFPYYLADNGKQWVQADGEEVSFKKLQEITADKWAEDRSDRGLIVAWNYPSSPLLAGVLPSFQYGRGVHSCWLTHEVLSSEMRLVFDASSLVLGLYPENFSTKQSMSSSRNASLPDGLWEYTVNRHLAAVYGSYCYQLPRRHSPMLYKVVKHSEDYMLSKVEELTLSNFVIGKEQNVHAEGDSLWSKENICLPGHLPSYSSEPSAAVNVPYSLGKLLQLAADKNRSVVLGVAGASYRDMLMSWVCRLHHLRVTNFVVCALDHEIYEFSVLQGLPVFRDPLSPKNVSFDDCHFGTQCFQQGTKVKSRVVLEILRLGYNVLLSDVDVYWFDNPVQFLYSLGPATFAAQSDEYNETGPINLPRRLNSGFYFVRSNDTTITAMEKLQEQMAKVTEMYPLCDAIGLGYLTVLRDCEIHCSAEGAEVKASGGLHVIGTSLHESRRIDNQLRGRAGRQGDPGSTRFMVSSLQDEMFRKFNLDTEWAVRLISRITNDEDIAIESNAVVKQLLGLQINAEKYYFGIRKSLVEFDEVLEVQRKHIYNLRQVILSGDSESCSEQIFQYMQAIVDEIILGNVDPQKAPKTWNLAKLLHEFVSLGGNLLGGNKPKMILSSCSSAADLLTLRCFTESFKEIQEEDLQSSLEQMLGCGSIEVDNFALPNMPVPPNSFRGIRKKTSSVMRWFAICVDDTSKKGRYTNTVNLLRKYFGDFLIATYLDAVHESRYDDAYIRGIEREILLKTLDNLWKDHLVNMNKLSSAVNVRSFGHRNPLEEYKIDGCRFFISMLSATRRLTVESLLHYWSSPVESEEIFNTEDQ